MIIAKEIEISGKSVKFEVGRVAKQAGGAVVASCGGTVVLAVSTMGKESSEPMDFFPLTVLYSEKMYFSKEEEDHLKKRRLVQGL